MGASFTGRPCVWSRVPAIARKRRAKQYRLFQRVRFSVMLSPAALRQGDAPAAFPFFYIEPHKDENIEVGLPLGELQERAMQGKGHTQGAEGLSACWVAR